MRATLAMHYRFEGSAQILLASAHGYECKIETKLAARECSNHDGVTHTADMQQVTFSPMVGLHVLGMQFNDSDGNK